MRKTWSDNDIEFLRKTTMTNEELSSHFKVSYDSIIKIKQKHKINKLSFKNNSSNNTEWKIISELPQYAVNEFGEVKNIKRGNILKPRVDTRGYLTIQFKINTITLNRTIHRLVGLAFLENINNLPEINHIDGNKLNNHISNLEWVSKSENMQHAHDTGLIKLPKGNKHWTKRKSS
jgi:hypothetical protein